MMKNQSREVKSAIVAAFSIMSAMWLGCGRPSNQDDAVESTNKRYNILVDYSRTLAEMIEAGHYDLVNSVNIVEENFPIQRPSTVKPVEIVFINVDKPVSTDGIVEHIDRQSNIRSARIEEILTFGEKYPDIQRDFPVIAPSPSLDVNKDGILYVPALWTIDSNRRIFGIIRSNMDVGSDCRFMAIRK